MRVVAVRIRFSTRLQVSIGPASGNICFRIGKDRRKRFLWLSWVIRLILHRLATFTVPWVNANWHVVFYSVRCRDKILFLGKVIGLALLDRNACVEFKLIPVMHFHRFIAIWHQVGTLCPMNRQPFPSYLNILRLFWRIIGGGDPVLNLRRGCLVLWLFQYWLVEV